MSFPSPLAPVLTQLDAQTKQLQHLKQRSRSRGRAVAGVINWVHWGLEKSCCKRNGGLFFDCLTQRGQNESQNVSTASPTARDVTSGPVWEQW